MKKIFEIKAIKAVLHVRKETLRTLDPSSLAKVGGAVRIRIPGGWMDENTVFYPDAV